MDVSILFRASVKTISLKRKALDENVSKVTQRNRQQSAFRRKSHAVITQIVKLKKFLLQNRPSYLDFTGHLVSKNRMTDEERNEIDNGAQEIISTCSQLIKELKREIADTEVSRQNQEHREIMLYLIEEYLKDTCKVYLEQKAIRIKKTMEVKKLIKLEESVKLQLSENHSQKLCLNINNDQALEPKETWSTSLNSSPMKIQELNGDVNPMTYDEELSTEDIQMFESENEQLYNELNTITEEVKQIESKVIHISELQQIFTEKVLAQDHDLDKLMTTVVGSTENVKEANEQIRQAIQRNAGLRVWILFFLLVMSFSLLFLDWYNP
ncbi:hypothetical protein PV325_007438 [Microctonus aethiopoides]|uniref:Syntaxin-18 n=1 Tax=Microctonus aethiopoides TaxID=144406 RepID=A0AA39KRT9_9HYME|nr:hypothetical protein PV325_007438 [Microctonus aethiopoides]KAK0098697.1 hypothetical protein PV326_005108 [Microctonus aethiopoides]KAK0171548.1 hypothetical protein PV328_004991 [Microctonus aethiopoides]